MGIASFARPVGARTCSPFQYEFATLSSLSMCILDAAPLARFGLAPRDPRGSVHDGHGRVLLDMATTPVSQRFIGPNLSGQDGVIWVLM